MHVRTIAARLTTAAMLAVSFPCFTAAADEPSAPLLDTETLGADFDSDESDVYRPTWTGRAGAVILQRVANDSLPFVYNEITGEEIVQPSSFTQPFQGGLDVGLIRHGQYADLEVRYFGIDGWTTGQDPVLAGAGVRLAFPGSEPSPVPALVTGAFGAELNSVEVNLRKNVNSRLTWLAGFRYLSYYERLGIFADVGPGMDEFALNLQTNNDLFGGQIGADAILWDNGGRFHVEGAIKAGVFGNASMARLTAPDDFGEPETFPLYRDQTAFVGDLSFTGVYRLTEHWNIRAGYQLLWISGTALASRQTNLVDFNSGFLGVDSEGTAFFHGATVGLETIW